MRVRNHLTLAFSLALSLIAIAGAAACEGPSLQLSNTGTRGASGPLFVSEVLAPVVPSSTGCVYSAKTTTGASESTGVVDVSFSSLSSYTPELLLGNQGSEITLVEGAVTTVTDLAGDTSLITMFAAMCEGGDEAACATGKAMASGSLATPGNPFSTVETAMLQPASEDPSYSAISVTLIDGATLNILRTYFANALEMEGVTKTLSLSLQLLTYTTVDGTTLSGSTLASNNFEFPVTFTYGALITNLAMPASGACIDTTEPAVATCVPGQDAASTVAASPTELLPNCDGSDVVPVGDGGM